MQKLSVRNSKKYPYEMSLRNAKNVLKMLKMSLTNAKNMFLSNAKIVLKMRKNVLSKMLENVP